MQKSGGPRLEKRSPGSCHELEEEVFVGDKSISVAFDDLGEVVCPLQLSRTYGVPSMVDDTFQMVLHGRGERDEFEESRLPGDPAPLAIPDSSKFG